MRKISLIFTSLGGAISGLLGVIGLFGFCSAPWIVTLFALFGLNSMLLATYNKIFLIFGLIFFSLAAAIFLRGRKVCPPEKSKTPSFAWGLIILLSAVLLFSAGWLAKGRLTPQARFSPKTSSSAQDLAATDAFLKFKQIKASIIPSGIPEIYGDELGISFEKAQEAIDRVAPFDPTYGSQKIILTGYDMERYKKIGGQIACEYCCGAKTLVFETGEAACGCDHSQMMRGLAAWLIQNRPEVSDEQILGELKKWKAVFFPQQTLTTKIAEMEKAGEPGIKELLQEFPDFLPKMVEGC